jgi:hypothetical protein
MLYQRLADLVVAAHALFVAFVLLGGLLVMRRPRLARVHVPAALWGVLIEFVGIICPLTPLEVELRRRGGAAGYEGGFIEHYLEGVLYPSGLTPRLQVWFGTLALVVNLAIYWRVIVMWRRRARDAAGGI